MVVLCGAFFVAQARVDQDFMSAGIDIRAVYRILDFFTGRTLPEDVCAKIGFKPSCIARVNLGFVNAYGSLCMR